MNRRRFLQGSVLTILGGAVLSVLPRGFVFGFEAAFDPKRHRIYREARKHLPTLQAWGLSGSIYRHLHDLQANPPYQQVAAYRTRVYLTRYGGWEVVSRDMPRDKGGKVTWTAAPKHAPRMQAWADVNRRQRPDYAWPIPERA